MTTITEDTYKQLAARTKAELRRFAIMRGDVPKEVYVLTCDDCPHRLTCEFAGDGYNTDGDCLAEK